MPSLQKEVSWRPWQQWWQWWWQQWWWQWWGDFDGDYSDLDAAGVDAVDDDYFDHDDSNDKEFNVRRFYGDAAGLDDIDDYDVEEFNGNRFYHASKNYKRALDHLHNTG